jgi:hypothetical protein
VRSPTNLAARLQALLSSAVVIRAAQPRMDHGVRKGLEASHQGGSGVPNPPSGDFSLGFIGGQRPCLCGQQLTKIYGRNLRVLRSLTFTTLL